MGILRAIMARVDLDGSGFEKGAIKVENAAMAMGRRVASDLKGTIGGALGAFGAGELLKSVVGAVQRIHELSNEFRVSTDEVQKWDIAAKRAGLAAEDVGNAYNKAKKAREAAVSGDDKMANAFGRFGVSLETLKDASVSTEEVLHRMVNAIGGRRILDDEDVAGMEIFGKSGAKVLSAFEQLHALGPVKLIAKEDVETFNELSRSFNELKRQAVATAAHSAGFLSTLAKGWTFVYSATATGLDWMKGRIDAAEAGIRIMDKADELANGPDMSGVGTKSTKQATSWVVDLHGKDKELAKERLSLAEKIFQTQMAGMGVERQRIALKQKIAELDKEAISALYEDNDARAIQLAKDAEEYRQKLEHLDKTSGKNLAVDSLTRIGGSAIGHSEIVNAQIARQQLAVAKHHVTVSEEIVRILQTRYPGRLIQ